MAPARVVWDLEADEDAGLTSKYGWSEDMYYNGGGDIVALQALMTNNLPAAIGGVIGGLLYNRRSILQKGWKIARVRGYAANTPRVGFNVSLAPSVGGGLYISGTNPQVDSEQPFDRVLCNFSAVNGHRRPVRFGGIPDHIGQAGGQYLNNPVWRALFDRWVACLNANFIGMRYSTPSAFVPILSISVASPSSPVVSPSYPAVLLPGDLTATFATGIPVRITGVQGMTNMNGQWTVYDSLTVLGNTLVVLTAKRGVIVSGTATAAGKIKPLTYGYDVFLTGFPSRIVKRDTGRPSDLPRGRRSRRPT